MAEQQDQNITDDMQHFTATGRPYRAPQADKEGWSMNSMTGGDTFGASPVNHLPVKYTDDSLITVAVLRPEDVGKALPPKPKKSLFGFRRSADTQFVMKRITRREYLRHYAKDNDGKYIGTEEPGEDCILRGEDLAVHRGGTLQFKHEIDETADKGTVIR